MKKLHPAQSKCQVAARIRTQPDFVRKTSSFGIG